MVDGQDRTHPPAKGLDLELENWKGGSGAVQGILSQWQGSLPNLLGTDGQNPFPLAARNIENFLNLTCPGFTSMALQPVRIKTKIQDLARAATLMFPIFKSWRLKWERVSPGKRPGGSGNPR